MNDRNWVQHFAAPVTKNSKKRQTSVTQGPQTTDLSRQISRRHVSRHPHRPIEQAL
ncbi:hypothetical protein THICB3110102 [Thiomonas sp. CB3]|nr:hypothetical protein THICB3110102 [Thiomonas sp. CB3]